MKATTAFLSLALVGAAAVTVMTVSNTNAEYEFTSKIGSYWSLADKSSTLIDKSVYIDRYVAAFEKEKLDGFYNALRYKSPDNSFDRNFEALKTLGRRLHEIETMPADSLAYQTAIQQITSQEQGDAAEMNRVLFGCWMLKHNPFLWDWVGGCFWLVSFTGLVVGVVGYPCARMVEF